MSRQFLESVINLDPNVDFVTEVASQPVTKKAPKQPFVLTLFQNAFRLGEMISPTLAGKFAYNLWLTPPKFKTPASEKDILERADVQLHTIDNNRIATFHWGQTGPTVLLVHGWSGRGTQLGSFVDPLLDAGYQVLSFDAPAHGKSSGKKTNLYEIASTITALQELFGDIDSVITHSFGGPCTSLALLQGLKAKHIVSICPPATTIGLVDKFCEALHIQKKTEKVIKRHIEDTFGINIWHDVAMVNTVKKIKPEDLQSVTVIHDAHDIDVPWQEGQAVAYAWNNAPFIITSDLGHRRILKDKEVIETAIEKITAKKITV